MVGGSIIDDNYVIIGVILHDYGLDVVKISVIIDVIVGGNDNADGQFRVLVCLILLLIVFNLLNAGRIYLVQTNIH